MQDLSPDLFINAALGYQRTAAIKAAVALDLFTVLGQVDGVLEEAAARTRASARGLRILCDYLTVNGFLVKEGARYGLTPSTGAFLSRGSPAYMGGVVDFLAAPEMMSLWLEDPVAYVREGGSVGLANVAPNNPLWLTFARAMVPFMAHSAQAIAEQVHAGPRPPRRVLDVAAGHGIFGIEIAKKVPSAQVVALDWESVLAVAQENAQAAGVAERYQRLSGSAFEVDWGTDYDLVLLTNFLHHFDRETCVELLRKARGSLAPGGQVLALEFVPNEDRVSPPFPAMFSFMMLGSTPKGDAYTAREYTEMGRSAGFSDVTVRALQPSPQSLITFR